MLGGEEQRQWLGCQTGTDPAGAPHPRVPFPIATQSTPKHPQLGSRPPPAPGGAAVGQLPPPTAHPSPIPRRGCSAPWGCPPWTGPPATRPGPAAVQPALFLFQEELCWKRNKSRGEAINSLLLHTSSPPPPRARSSLRGRSSGMAPGGSPQPPAPARREAQRARPRANIPWIKKREREEKKKGIPRE